MLQSASLISQVSHFVDFMWEFYHKENVNIASWITHKVINLQKLLAIKQGSQTEMVMMASVPNN